MRSLTLFRQLLVLGIGLFPASPVLFYTPQSLNDLGLAQAGLHLLNERYQFLFRKPLSYRLGICGIAGTARSICGISGIVDSGIDTGISGIRVDISVFGQVLGIVSGIAEDSKAW
jgi:hypothetical protein